MWKRTQKSSLSLTNHEVSYRNLWKICIESRTNWITFLFKWGSTKDFGLSNGKLGPVNVPYRNQESRLPILFLVPFIFNWNSHKGLNGDAELETHKSPSQWVSCGFPFQFSQSYLQACTLSSFTRSVVNWYVLLINLLKMSFNSSVSLESAEFLHRTYWLWHELPKTKFYRRIIEGQFWIA